MDINAFACSYKTNYQKSMEDERLLIQRERARLLEELKKFQAEKEPQSQLYERIWKLEEEVKVYQQRLALSSEHCSSLEAKLKQVQANTRKEILIFCGCCIYILN